MHKVGFLGISGIDNTMNEGLAYGSQIMINGDSGIGKSVLAAQFVKEGLDCQDTCIYVCCDEPPAATRDTLRHYGLHPVPYEERGRLVFIDAYSLEPEGKYYFPADDPLEKFLALESRVINTVNGEHIRLIADSLSTLLIGRDSQEILDFHRYRLKLRKKCRILTMDLIVDEVIEDTTFQVSSHLYDVIIKLYYTGSPDRPVRALHVGKLRSGKFDSSQLSYTIDSNIGIVVIPNLWG